ncbi:MAG TPA: rhomboid family intramembrane serine protease [Polyangiaceae bacterium]|nr:rhomboid family intramembrane serine protease [Polyangiaceae bacterium]
MFLFFPTSADRTVYGMPWFTVGTVAICFLSWVASFYIDVWGPLGFVPGDDLGITVVLYAYAHGGLVHLLGNMVFLWCMGVNLETRWGTPTYAAVYLVGAAVSGLAYGSLHAGSTIPLVGASGAIAALMGAFLVSLFKTRIKFWYLIWYLFGVSTGTFKVPAYVVLPLWFLSDLLGAYVEARGAGGGVAYSAHVGGFMFGFIVAAALKLSGYEAKLVESTGADVHDDPSQWTALAADTDRVPRRFGPAVEVVPQVAAGPDVGSTVPGDSVPPAGAPPRCSSCKLVNMPGATSCRRCGAAL